MSGRARRAGRRPGQPDTREQILTSARDLFSEKGYEATSVRAIAAGASVDAALINHYFGSKEGLFRAALELPEEPARLLARVLAESTPEELPARLARTFVSLWEDPDTQPQLLILLRRAIDRPDHLRSVPEYMQSHLLIPDVVRHVSSPAEARVRFALVQSHLFGVATLRHVLRVEPWAGMTPDQLEAMVVPTIAHYLHDDLPLDLHEGKHP